MLLNNSFNCNSINLIYFMEISILSISLEMIRWKTYKDAFLKMHSFNFLWIFKGINLKINA